ncbi:vanin-like protein 3 isoform X2 [Lycorma delicatula]|uniref:vanin-like protein 3 isoform X2 n=1 Tax=Lycorma delicatula TaxID=130591 RepID=UPI003F5100A8
MRANKITSNFSNTNCCCIFVRRYIVPAIIFIIFQGHMWDSSNTCLASMLLERDHYIGAVVEFSPELWDQSEEPKYLLVRNSRKLHKIAEEAAREKADIIVTPECGLSGLNLPVVRDKLKLFTTFIPNVEDNEILCEEKNKLEVAEHLKELSCAAQKNNIYLVANMLEKVSCNKTHPGCPTDGLLIYNTNVAFDRTGKLIAKYHKFNLFIEPETNITSAAELSTFHTDFGVQFGMFICFDILFKKPALEIIEKTNVKNIVYSTAWFSEIPFFTAVESQAGYSYSQNINLLASGYSFPKNKNFGSGIYAGEKGPLVMIMPEKPTNKLLIAKVPIHPDYFINKETCDIEKQYCDIFDTKKIDIHFNEDEKLLKTESNNLIMDFYHDDISKFSTVLLDKNKNINEMDYKETETVGEKTFNYNEAKFKCEVTVKWEKYNNTDLTEGMPVYRLVGYSGTRSYGGLLTVDIEVCGLIACKSYDISTCGYTPDFSKNNLTNITSIVINIERPHKSNPFIMTLDKNMLALRGNEFKFTNNFNKITDIQSSTMILETPHNDLITFAMYKPS